jgi:hypothetical protein
MNILVHKRYHMPQKVSLKDVMKVLHADLIGKDSHRGITLTYGWMANQVGHFALGFIPTCALVIICGYEPIHSLFYVGLFWLLFEIYNALSPLYKKEYKGNGSFRIHWTNLTFDTFTDLCFFWFGGFSFYMFMGTDQLKWLIFAAALVFLLICIRFWFLTKLFQQNAFLPYQFRLSQWDGEISIKNKEIVSWFLSNGHQPHHFIVYGGKGKGKTRLTVGMANELAIRHLRSTYTTLSKWVGLLQESDNELEKSKISLWKWTDSHFLLIDDINPGVPESANKFSAADLKKFVEFSNGDRNKLALQKMSVAWVVGSNNETDTIESWVKVVRELGLNEDQIHIIDLNN